MQIRLGRGLSFGHMQGYNTPTPGAVTIRVAGQEAARLGPSACKEVHYTVEEQKPPELNGQFDDRAWSQLREEIEVGLKPLSRLRYQMNLCIVSQPIVFLISVAVFFAMFFAMTAGNGDAMVIDILFVIFFATALPSFALVYTTGRYNSELAKLLPTLGTSLTQKFGVHFRATYTMEYIGSRRAYRVVHFEVTLPGTTAPAMPGAVYATAAPIPGAPVAQATVMNPAAVVVQVQATPMPYPTAQATPMYPAATPMVVEATPMPKV